MGPKLKHRCWDAMVAQQYITTPMYIAQNMFDENQIHDELLCPPNLCKVRVVRVNPTVRARARARARARVRIKEYVCMYACMYIYIYIYVACAACSNPVVSAVAVVWTLGGWRLWMPFFVLVWGFATLYYTRLEQRHASQRPFCRTTAQRRLHPSVLRSPPTKGGAPLCQHACSIPTTSA